MLLPLARSAFVIPDPDLVYLDGNSLGRPLKKSLEDISRAMETQWGERLIGSWNESWLPLMEECRRQLAPLIGARVEEVLVADQTTINLHKVVGAALGLSRRGKIVTDAFQFPSDLYVLQKLADEVVVVESRDGVGIDLGDLAEALGDDTGVLCLSLVGFRSGFKWDMAAVRELARSRGVLTVWDLSHAAGAVVVDLDGAGADFAVGCTYKYLNGGPGAPGYLYVNERHLESAESPLAGWLGHQAPFAFDREYRAAPGVVGFQVGTPPILSMAALPAAFALLGEVGMDQVALGGRLLTSAFVELADRRLPEFRLATPRDPDRRGSHVSLEHPEARQLTAALVRRGIVPDFRAPNLVRFGFCPLYNGFEEGKSAVAALEELIRSGEHLREEEPAGIVT